MAEIAESAFERVRKYGTNTTPMVDLLAIALSRHQADVVANETEASKLIAKYPPGKLGDLSAAELLEHCGLEPFEVERYRAAFELGRRSAVAAKGDRDSITKASDVAEYFSWLKEEPKEHFCALFLDSKNKVLMHRIIHIGTLNMSVVGSREVFRLAVHESAASIIVVHNHPSGDPEPSPEDIRVTQKLAEAGKLLDISVLDHVIVGHHKYVSLNERGVL